MKTDLDALILHLAQDARDILEASGSQCLSRGGYEITIEDFLVQMLEEPGNIFSKILKQFYVPEDQLIKALKAAQDLRSGNTCHPVFSPLLIEWLQKTWLLCTLKFNVSQINTGCMILSLLSNADRFGRMPYFTLLESISREKLFNFLESEFQVDNNFVETLEPVTGSNALPENSSALNRYTTDFTRLAQNGNIDPVFCRDNEIRQMIDVLARRRKNNPIVVGEPGVGKTAVVEGLALKIVQGDVPDILKPVRLLGLDMGLLQAGASVKGEFEKRLKAVIDEVKHSEQMIILFIDEAHTLVGAGAQAGGSDAANLLKPALARGELRTIAATTWSEYKKYFEKDPALARRFQLVQLVEPTAEQAMIILRGLKHGYEKNHGVYIQDGAIEAAARLSERYISGRQLPDKAIDVLDTACARVKISISSKPAVMNDIHEKTIAIKREIDALNRDSYLGLEGKQEGHLAELHKDLKRLLQQYQALEEQWSQEADISRQIIQLRQEMNSGPGKAEQITKPHETDKDSFNRQSARLDELGRRFKQLSIDNSISEKPLVSFDVDEHLIREVIAEWTGIPMTKMYNDTTDPVVDFKASMLHRIKGQDHAVDILNRAVQTSKAGLSNPDAPNGIFLLVGPSGVGKTETGIALAELLYGGERFMTTINMSEFQEKHHLSRLVGSPPGYVGYGEGGILTEAIRRQPYSVVLLDEVEKAHPEVLNVFYQVFDKGILNDGEGREIDFKNTMILLTSNLASDIITDMCSNTEGQQPDYQALIDAIRPVLSQYFKPALLARMTIVPYYPVHGEVMQELTRIKLARVAQRLDMEHKIQLSYDDDVLEQIASKCQVLETGARNIDHIINHNIIPQIATRLLQNLGNDGDFESLKININEQGTFEYQLA